MHIVQNNTPETPAAEMSRVELAIAESRKIRSGIATECDRIEQILSGFKDKAERPAA